MKHLIETVYKEDDFMNAVETGDIASIRRCLYEKKCDINEKDYLGRTALHIAIICGHYEIVELLLEAGINPVVKDRMCMTPLSLVLTRCPKLKLVELLFKNGAVIMPRKEKGDVGLFLYYVMICQATPEDKMIMELLLRKGAVINDPAAPAGRQALHLAALANNCELIEILLSLGADIFATTQLNETARDIAVYFRCKEAEMLLAEKEYDMMLLYEREKGSFQPRGSAYNKDRVRFSVHSAMTESFFGLSKRASTDKEYGSSSKGAESTKGIKR